MLFPVHLQIAEFKNALKNLGVRHPQAYRKFVRDLQPTGVNVSSVRVENASEFHPENTSAQEGVIVASWKGSKERNQEKVLTDKEKSQLVQDFVRCLPLDDVTVVASNASRPTKVKEYHSETCGRESKVRVLYTQGKVFFFSYLNIPEAAQLFLA